jgi:hypothetical protein
MKSRFRLWPFFAGLCSLSKRPYAREKGHGTHLFQKIVCNNVFIVSDAVAAFLAVFKGRLEAVLKSLKQAREEDEDYPICSA